MAAPPRGVPVSGQASVAAVGHVPRLSGGGGRLAGVRFGGRGSCLEDQTCLGALVPVRSRGPRSRQIVLVQCEQRVASASTVSLQYGHVLVGAGGAAGASLMNVRAIMKTTKATTMKAITTLMKLP